VLAVGDDWGARIHPDRRQARIDIAAATIRLLSSSPAAATTSSVAGSAHPLRAMVRNAARSSSNCAPMKAATEPSVPAPSRIASSV
jgi:hypothetical protein